MRRLIALVLVVAACGGTTPQPSDTSSEVATTVSGVASPTTTLGEVATTTEPATPGTSSGREAAPDFTLDLGDGGTYTLSDGARPVYLVFWAEW